LDPLEIKSPPWRNLHDLKVLLDCLQPALIVGGAVRNAYLEHSISDIDIATEHTPEVVSKFAKSAGFRVIETGLKHGTVTCVKDNAYEVTTLRVDKVTDGRRAIVEFSNSWEEDAKRRDFTINALYSTFEGLVYDFVGGAADLNSRNLRFIGDPYKRIHEDYLRILRFFRFYSEYCYSYDANSLVACLETCPELVRISKERCTSEFFKLLETKKLIHTLQLMNNELLDSAGLPRILPTTLEQLGYKYKQEKLSTLGKVACFAERHRMVLSNKQSNLLSQLYKCKDLYKQSDYINWINSCSDSILWDGIILKGRNNDIMDNLDIWLEKRFLVTGKDLISIGIEPGPIIGKLLAELKQTFCNGSEPMSAELLIQSLQERINNK